MKNCLYIPILINMGHKWQALYLKSYVNLMFGRYWFL